MNLREGRIGRQEAAASAWIASAITGIFALDTVSTYAAGNASYAATLFAAALSLAVFWLVTAAMRKRSCRSLFALYETAFGGAVGFFASLLTVLTLIYAAAVPLGRMLAIMNRYIFVESAMWIVNTYFLVVVILLVLCGFETIGRTARLFSLTVFLSIALVLLVASPAYEAYRLYPLLGGDAVALTRQSFIGVSRFLPALLALLICCRGVQGLKNAVSAGWIAAAGGAVLTAVSQICLGMTYSYATLSNMYAPMYRLTMAVRTGSAYLRTDKLLLFFWVIGALLAAVFLCYAAAMLYTRAAHMRDIRPAAVVASVTACTLALLGHAGTILPERAARFFWDWMWVFAAAPPLLAAGTAMLRKEKA